MTILGSFSSFHRGDESGRIQQVWVYVSWLTVFATPPLLSWELYKGTIGIYIIALFLPNIEHNVMPKEGIAENNFKINSDK